MKRRLCPSCEREAFTLCLVCFCYGMALGAVVCFTILTKGQG